MFAESLFNLSPYIKSPFNRLTRIRSFASCLCLLAAANMALGQEDAAKQRVDPSGTWKWERDFNGSKIDYTLRLKQKDKTLTGTYQTTFENSVPDLADPVAIENAKLDGRKISFSVTRSLNGNEFTVVYNGTLVGRDKIEGSSTLDFENGSQEFDWNAEFAVLAEDLIGKWKTTIDSPTGVIESSMTLKKVGGKLGGTYHSSVFGDHPIENITLKDGELSFAVTFGTDDGDYQATYKAKPRGDQFEGVISADVDGQQMEAPLKGIRVASAKSTNTDQ